MTRGDDIELVWKALADPTRRQLLDQLRAGRKSTGELCSAFPEMTRFAVMKHLRVLEGARLVIHRREGRLRWNHLNAVPLRRAYDHYVRPLDDDNARSLLGLRNLAESGGPEMSEGNLPGMHIEQEVRIAAPPARVWNSLTEGIGAWWTRHFSEKPRAIRLEPRIGGRFYEEFDDAGNGALFCTVIHLQRPVKLILQGTMGMVKLPTIGLITFELEADGAGTLVKLSHRVLGEVSDGARENYGKGWTELLNTGLKKHAESNP